MTRMVLFVLGGIFLSCADSEPEIAPDVVAQDSIQQPEKSKIRFQDSSGLFSTTSSSVYGVALVDYSGDGWPDVSLATKSGVMLFENRGQVGGFSTKSNRLGVGIDLTHAHQLVWVDYDGDGDLDLYVTRRANVQSDKLPQKHTNRLLRNNGSEQFEDVTQFAGLELDGYWEGAAFGDLDGDGDLDLVVLGGVDYTKARANVKPGYEGYPNRFWRNRGDGTFEDMTNAVLCTGPPDGVGWGVLLVDYDLDGHLDMFISNDRRPSTLCRNRGDGTFDDISSELSLVSSTFGAMGMAVGDVNGDGCLDIYATIFGPDVVLSVSKEANFLDIYPYLLGDAADPTASYSGYGATFMDADLDGDQDIMWVAAFDTQDYAQGVYIPGGMGLLENRGGQTPNSLVDAGSEANELFKKVHHAWGLARGDYDLDGDIDALIGVDINVPGTSPNARSVHSDVMLLENITDTKGFNFVEISLVQPGPNTRAVGATVVVSVSGRRAIQVVTAGSSYLSAHQYPLHFGLGVAEQPDWVHVVWPNGAKQTFTDIGKGRVTLTKSSNDCVPSDSCNAIELSSCHDFGPDIKDYQTNKGVLTIAQCQQLCEQLEACGWFPAMDFCDYKDCLMLCPGDDVPQSEGVCAIQAQCDSRPACVYPGVDDSQRCSE